MQWIPLESNPEVLNTVSENDLKSKKKKKKDFKKFKNLIFLFVIVI
jgi:hypothetical protein